VYAGLRRPRSAGTPQGAARASAAVNDPPVGPTSLLPGGKWVNLKSFDPLAGCFGSGRPTRCNPSRFQNLPHEAARAKTPSQSRFPPSFRESSCEGACRHRDEQRRPSRLPTSTSASSPPVGRNPRPTIEKRVDFSFFAPLAGPSAVGQPYHTNARHRCRHPRFACNKDTSQNAGVELVFDTAPKSRWSRP